MKIVQKMVFIFLALGTFLMASQDDLATMYRSGHFKTILQELDKRLGEKGYWNGVLSDYDTTYGWYENDKYLLMCNDQEIKLYEQVKKQLKYIQSAQAVFGRVEGDKQIEGDLKTPVGIYRLTEKKDHVDPFYGPLAFVTSYPNLYDRTLKKNGNGIWLHGYPMGCDEKDNTKGCIAVNNDDLINLSKNIDHTKTLLISNCKDRPINANKETLAELMAFIYRWRAAWKENRFDDYIESYADDFVRYDGKKLNAFKAMKKNVFAIARQKEIDFSDFTVTPYPNSLGKVLWRVTFHEDYRASNYKFQGLKELYIQEKRGYFRIVVEQ